MTVQQLPIYGYIRVDADLGDEEILDLERELKQAADSLGFCLGRVFYEEVPGAHTAFYELREHLQQTKVRHVIVPSTTHFARNILLQRSMIDCLVIDADAEVLELGDV